MFGCTPSKTAWTCVCAVMLGCAGLAGAQDKAKPTTDKPAAKDAATHEYSLEGQYVESCSCRVPCSCEMTGPMKGCLGVGAYDIKKGSYNGVDISGAKFAYASGVTEWVDLYIDAKDEKQREAVKGMASGFLKNFGTIQDVKPAKVDIKRDGYAFDVNVDNGKVMAFKTEPVMGGDGKTPVTHTNIGDPFNSTMLQGKGVSTKYTAAKDSKSFTIDKGRNSYCNDKMKASGQI